MESKVLRTLFRVADEKLITQREVNKNCVMVFSVIIAKFDLAGNFICKEYRDGCKTPFKNKQLHTGLLYQNGWFYLMITKFGRKYITEYTLTYPTANDLYAAWEQATRRVIMEKKGFL